MKKYWWLTIIFSITMLQLGSMYYLNLYLKPPVLPVVASATDTPSVKVPDNAIEPLSSPDRQHVAYLAADQHYLIVAGLQGTLFKKWMNNVPFKKWLDNSTLLYFDRTSELSGYILQLDENKTVPVKSWFGTKWAVVDAYFSPYIELLYLELKDQNGYGHIYRYDAVTGIQELPLGYIRIDRINYDPVTDSMKIYDISNGVWTYENNQLKRPDGSIVNMTTQKIKAMHFQATESSNHTFKNIPLATNGK